MKLSAINPLVRAGQPPQLEVHAIDPMIYLVFRRSGDDLVPVTDERGKTLRFPSRHRALCTLAETGLAQTEFVHRSAYTEMIGIAQDNWPAYELRETVKLRNLT